MAALSAPPGSLLGFVEPFLESLRVRNYSEATLKGREYYLTVFHRWLLERGVEEVGEVTPQILERYRRHLSHHRQTKGKGQREGQPLSFRSQHTHLLPLRAFFKWMARQRHILYNPASELELPRLEKRLPRHVLTVAEVEQLLSVPDLASPLGLRDRAMMEVVYSTGMRRGEVAHLKGHDLDRERGTVFIRQGKGKKDRVVPIGARALLWVEKYLAEARPLFAVEPDAGYLFLAP
ncbi:MAG TPA: tyrosine-type recombinase/integrase, partial [Fibrobacteria bacterium]|nr:tyrosine-type recombinase/integrase [Fibrobacteria bacterium]